MEQGDKEKIRRAYKKACQMNLSAEVQNRLREELENFDRPIPNSDDKAPELKSEPAPNSLDIAREIPQNEYQQFKNLLTTPGSMVEASQFFADHSLKICQDLNRVEDELELDIFFSALKKLPEPDRLLSTSSFGRLLVRAKTDEQRFSQLAQFFATRTQNTKREDFLVMHLFFSDPLTWFSKNPVNWQKLSRFITLHSIEYPKWCNFFGVYEKNQFLLHENDLDDALWGPLRSDSRFGLWCAIGNLHGFLSQQESDPTLLWEAWAFFQDDPKTKEYWTRLHAWALSLSTELLTTKKKDIFSHLQIVDPRGALAVSDIENYFNRFGPPKNRPLQEHLLEFVAGLGGDNLEFTILHKLASQRRLNDSQLERT